MPITVKCQLCFSDFQCFPSRIKRGAGKYCSKLCQAVARTGPGRSIHNEGYIFLKLPSHPRANAFGFVYEHIVVAEKHIRYLKPGEEVHHLNGIRDDNKPENLEIIESKGKHRREHARLRVAKAGGNPDTQRICAKCHILKMKIEFSSNPMCKPCSAEYQRNYRLTPQYRAWFNKWYYKTGSI